MHDRSIQGIRSKLRSRIERLHSADIQQFHLLLRHFLQFVDSSPIIAGIRDELMTRASGYNIDSTFERIMQREPLLGETEVESAAMGHKFMRELAESRDVMEFLTTLVFAYNHGRTDLASLFREKFLVPFCEYVDEQLNDQQAMLYYLSRYKHQCEWFHADRLRKVLEDDTQRGEKRLAFDLYEYLYAQGIDFHIEPQSASGIADLVAEQVGEHRVIADAKVFWPERSKGKPYLLSGFNQVYTYARDFNESVAYLVIYKMCKEDVTLAVPSTGTLFPSLEVNNKTIFFIIIDLCDHGAPASKRGPLKGIEVTAQDLVQSVAAVA